MCWLMSGNLLRHKVVWKKKLFVERNMDTRYTSPMPRQVSASYTMLMVPSMAEAGVHGWLIPARVIWLCSCVRQVKATPRGWWNACSPCFKPFFFHLFERCKFLVLWVNPNRLYSKYLGMLHTIYKTKRLSNLLYGAYYKQLLEAKSGEQCYF